MVYKVFSHSLLLSSYAATYKVSRNYLHFYREKWASRKLTYLPKVKGPIKDLSVSTFCGLQNHYTSSYVLAIYLVVGKVGRATEALLQMKSYIESEL